MVLIGLGWPGFRVLVSGEGPGFGLGFRDLRFLLREVFFVSVTGFAGFRDARV